MLLYITGEIFVNNKNNNNMYVILAPQTAIIWLNDINKTNPLKGRKKKKSNSYHWSAN